VHYAPAVRSPLSRLCPAALLACVLALTGCTEAEPPQRAPVVATVAPLADMVRQVAGDDLRVASLVPDGMDAHTFEPTARQAAVLAEASAFIANGLGLEDPSLALAEANLPEGAPIVRLGDTALSREEWVFDRSFPRERERPNPHAWLDVVRAMRYVNVIAVTVAEVAPGEAARERIRGRALRYAGQLQDLHEAIEAAAATVPAPNRKLLTYHDSWAYFGPRYGFEVIDAVQPPGLDEPSASDVRRVVDQIREVGVPVVFGSEVFPSGVLEAVAEETGVRFVGDLSDDALPGRPGTPEHSYIGMMVRNARIIVAGLGGDTAALDALDLGGAP
jgi:zinc/manganese transport system substrate-binding protein